MLLLLGGGGVPPWTDIMAAYQDKLSAIKSLQNGKSLLRDLYLQYVTHVRAILSELEGHLCGGCCCHGDVSSRGVQGNVLCMLKKNKKI